MALAAEKHTLGSDTLKARLITSALDLDWDEWADCSGDEIANGNGYTTGGVTLTVTSWGLDSNDIPRLIITSPVWTSSGAGMAAYRTLIVLNDTAPADEIIGGIDYGFLRQVPSGSAAPIYFDETNGLIAFGR